MIHLERRPLPSHRTDVALLTQLAGLNVCNRLGFRTYAVRVAQHAIRRNACVGKRCRYPGERRVAYIARLRRWNVVRRLPRRVDPRHQHALLFAAVAL